jgi:hypothetical protein
MLGKVAMAAEMVLSRHAILVLSRAQTRWQFGKMFILLLKYFGCKPSYAECW